MATTNIQTFSGDATVTSNLTVNTNTLHVDSVAGRVGIGKTNPTYPLDVSGTINATSFYSGGSQLQTAPWNSNGSKIYYTAGQVGIGTNSPAQSLEVRGGALRMTDTSGNNTDLYTAGSEYSTTKIPRPAGVGNYSMFGHSMSMTSGAGYMLVGAPYAVSGTYGNGRAYYFSRSGSSWYLGNTLSNPNAGTYSKNFGQCVDVSSNGSWAIVSDPQANYGFAFGYSVSGVNFSLQRTMTDPNPSSGTKQGTSVAVSNTGHYVFSMHNYDVNTFWQKTGFVQIHYQNTPGYAYLYASPYGTYDYFGTSVDIDDDACWAVIGSPGYGSTSTGATYTWYRSGTNYWNQATILTVPGGAANDNFGQSVAISPDGTYLIAGAPRENSSTGAAYIYVRASASTWNTTGTRIVASDAATGDYFGNTVSISTNGSYAIVGAHGKNSGTGAAYIFKRTGTNTWDLGAKIVASDAATGDYFGMNVDISDNGSFPIVGAPLNTDTYYQEGSVYVASPDVISLNSTKSIVANGSLLSFTGQHMCFPDGSMDQGLVVSANKNKYITLNGPLTTGVHAIKSSESIPVVCLSNVANDISVFGVVDRYEQDGTTRLQESGIGIVTQEKELGDNRVIVNSIGEGAMWVTNINGNLTSGDYITSSNVPGYGQKQDDDTVHSYTVAKITMDCDFEPEDLPVQVINKDDEGNNVLDTYGRLQWEDTGRTEKAYRIRYLTTEGQITDQANAVWTAAYVGCTYHCG